jgi:hypothetical protein
MQQRDRKKGLPPPSPYLLGKAEIKAVTFSFPQKPAGHSHKKTDFSPSSIPSTSAKTDRERFTWGTRVGIGSGLRRQWLSG